MLNLQIIAVAAPTVARTVKHWIYQLGGLGFIPLGILDNSVIPLPGSMDVLTLFLSARKEQLWLYYALMATLGSVIGGFVTYRFAREGGKETLARRFPAKTLQRVYDTFERWGVGAVAIPALLPPPVPMVPFVCGAGIMQYPVRKFLFALTLGRIIRYTLLAFLAARFGHQILAFISQHKHPGLFIVIGALAAAAALLFFIFAGKQQERTQD
ncbi:MAG TPA: VTT domain-containing protein [Candidatus Acidoferrum sp.]|nr:VTT domain-containing protein [Candidatus Acidoferrum sp.]